MKNVKLLLATCALFLVFGACGNSQNQKEQNEGTTETPMVITPDMAYCDVKGTVKRVDDIYFDRSGCIVSVYDVNPFAIEEPYRDFDTVTFDYTDCCKWVRDNQGQISLITCFEGREEFTWNDGHVAEILSYFEAQKTLTVYEYDPEGRLVKQAMYNGMEDEEVTQDEEWLFSTTEYTYLEFDKYGNWIRRKATYRDATVDFVDETEQTRVIEYFE